MAAVVDYPYPEFDRRDSSENNGAPTQNRYVLRSTLGTETQGQQSSEF